MKTNRILVVLLLASRIVCADGFVTLTAVDATGFTSFSSGAHWSDGQIPTGDKDYLVAFPGVPNTQIRSPERSDGASFAFPGRSLTIGTRVGIVGEADVAGYYLSKTVKGQVTVNDMRLVNGFFYLGSEGQHYHQGNITVLSPEDNPFTFVSEAKRDLTVRAKISGEPGTALSFKTSRFNLEGDNRGFKGQLRFENGATIYANSVNCFGGARDVFDPDALYFDGATITYTGSPNAEIGANNNIGVTVAGQGCAFSIQQTLQFTADVTGSGTFTRRDTHTCTLDVFGAWSTPLLVHDSRGYLKIRPSATFAADCSLVISNGFITASPAQVEDWLVITNRVVFAGGGVSGGCIVTDGVSAQQAPIRFEGPLVIEKPIRLAFYDPPSGVYTHETLHPLLQIPVSVRVVTADDFVPAFDKGAHQYGDLPKNAEVVVRTENGMQTVCLRFDPFVFNKTTANPSFFDTASHWSDNRAAHADADYVARNYDVRQSANPSEKYTFPGRSLLLQSDVEAHGYVIKQKEVTIGDLHVYNKSYVSVGGRAGTTGEAQCLKGRLTIHSTTDGVNGFSFIGSVDRVMTIDSQIFGSGWLNLSGNTFYRPTAVNTGYVGNVQANGRACIEISDETNLGGNPTSFQTRGLDLAADCGLSPLASCTLDDANRGLTVSNGYVNVDADKVLTLMLNSRILAGASFKKRGAGVLALGGVNQKITPYGTIAVEAGTLKALSSDAAKYAKLSFADGAAFAIDHVADTADARSTLGLAAVRGCTLEGDSLPVTVALPEDAPAVVEQPLLTVAAGEADAVAAKLDVAKPKGYAVEILQTPTTYDGVASVTLTAKFRKRGWALIIR